MVVMIGGVMSKMLCPDFTIHRGEFFHAGRANKL